MPARLQDQIAITLLDNLLLILTFKTDMFLKTLRKVTKHPGQVIRYNGKALIQ